MIRAADDELTIYERSREGRRAFVAPELDVPERPLDELLPARLRRAEPPRLPEVAEPEIVRHYIRLSQAQLRPRHGLLPAGLVHDEAQPQAARARRRAARASPALHPLQDPRRAQGALELMWRLQESLAEIAGLPHVSLQPSAGSHGELAGRAADPRLPRGPRRDPHQGADARHRARHQPGDRHDGRLRGGQGRRPTTAATSTSTTCAPRPTRTSPA